MPTNAVWRTWPVTCAIILIAASYLATRNTISWPVLFGDKQVAMFDLWSLQHFLTGILIGWFAVRHPSPVVATIGLAYAWEALEWFMEDGGMGARIASWKAGNEHWANRCIGDPAMVSLGAMLSMRQPRVLWAALPCAVGWLAVNALAKDCMTVQKHLLALLP